MPWKALLAGEMEKASTELEFETAALYRDRLAALSAIQSQQGINPRTVEEADVFAIIKEGGYSCVEVFFFRTGQNCGQPRLFSLARRSRSRRRKCWAPSSRNSTTTSRRRNSSCCRMQIEESRTAGRRASRSGRLQGRSLDASQSAWRKKELIVHAADQCARGARPQAERSPQPRAACLQGMATYTHSAQPAVPKRIEVYDNGHIRGTNAVGAMIVAGPDGFIENQYRKFNIKSRD